MHRISRQSVQLLPQRDLSRTPRSQHQGAETVFPYIILPFHGNFDPFFVYGLFNATCAVNPKVVRRCFRHRLACFLRDSRATCLIFRCFNVLTSVISVCVVMRDVATEVNASPSDEAVIEGSLSSAIAPKSPYTPTYRIFLCLLFRLP